MIKKNIAYKFLKGIREQINSGKNLKRPLRTFVCIETVG